MLKSNVKSTELRNQNWCNFNVEHNYAALGLRIV